MHILRTHVYAIRESGYARVPYYSRVQLVDDAAFIIQRILLTSINEHFHADLKHAASYLK